MQKTHLLITIDHEILERLNELPNKSGFINQLLMDYFNTTKDLSELLIEKKQSAEQLLTEAQEIELKLKEAREVEELHNKLQREASKAKEQSEEYWDRVREHQKESFYKIWNIPKEIIDTEFETYMFMLRQKKVKNIIEFMESRGFDRKSDKPLQ